MPWASRRPIRHSLMFHMSMAPCSAIEGTPASSASAKPLPAASCASLLIRISRFFMKPKPKVMYTRNEGSAQMLMQFSSRSPRELSVELAPY
ncbi:MAG: hypothetical protein BWZ10_01155 [candidate division BRC1 bacterium ADurb.BinA364]|nr:MAG: hypothetical protein BWZ10_01155 [candidate division BRC1 bacterium ADurb.BinA364]